MGFNPTQKQIDAINTDGTILVAAAAGSGKTAVLVERVMRRLTDKQNPVSADRILVVTFTNAAAAEMRLRIERRLCDELRDNPDDEWLTKQRYLISFAPICTIDSFCIDLVRRNFEDCGVEPDFKVSDGSGSLSLNAGILSDIISNQLENPSVAFSGLLELTGCEYDEANLTSLISTLFEYSRNLPFPDSYLKSLTAPYNLPFEKGHSWYEGAYKIAEDRLKTAVRAADRASKAAELIEKNTDKFIRYSADMIALVDTLVSECEKHDWDSLYTALSGAALPRLPSGSKEDPNNVCFAEQKDTVSGVISELKNIFFADKARIDAQRTRFAPAVGLLTDLVRQYGERIFDEHKKENEFTFSEIEQMALGLLCEYSDEGIKIKDTASDIVGCYDEVLVDEFQDVNDLQNMLFFAISNRGEHLFTVGDVKQSIYGFRGSNPKNFLDKKDSYIPLEIAKADEPKKIILSDNFRSRSGVCGFANYFFSLFMSKNVGGIVYDEEERLNASGVFPESSESAVELLIVPQGDNEDERIVREAMGIAEFIKKTVAKGEIIRVDKDTMRKANYGDFTILLNKVKDIGGEIAQVLTSQGIPVAYSGESYRDTAEVSTFLSLLKCIDNPRSDVELLSIMLSPIFGITAEQIALWRAEKKKTDMYTSVVFAAENGDDTAKAFVTRLSSMRSLAAMLPLTSLISELLWDTDYLNTVSALSFGSRRRANLLYLQKLAREYTEMGKSGISGFLRFVDSLPDNYFKVGSDSGDGVKIMTMHASKGLQFPICIIANNVSTFNKADSISPILHSQQFGIGFKYYDELQGEKVELLPHNLISQKARVDTVAEKLRLLYVAMTRAEDKLVVVSSSNDISKKLTTLAGKLDDSAPYITEEWISKTGSMNDWLLSAALVHPDGEKLRNICDLHVPVIKDAEGHFEVTFINPDPISSELKSEIDVAVYDGLVEDIKTRVAYSYPFDELKTVQAKASVSAVANKAENDRFAYTEKPAFMHKDGISATGRGTAVHTVMQFIDISRIPDIDAEIERLVTQQFITPEQAAATDRTALARFFKSGLFARILRSPDIRREMRFISEVPACRIQPDLSDAVKDTPVIIQGAVDLCFVEDDGVVVVDFKTDRVESADELKAAYSEQLEIYSKACEKIFALPVKQKIIYSFSLSSAIEL